MMTVTIVLTFDPTSDDAAMIDLHTWARARTGREVRTVRAHRTWTNEERARIARIVLDTIPDDAPAH